MDTAICPCPQVSRAVGIYKPFGLANANYLNKAHGAELLTGTFYDSFPQLSYPPSRNFKRSGCLGALDDVCHPQRSN